MSVKEIVDRYGIAPWKIDNEEEKSLAIKADKSDCDRKAYVNYYKEHEAEYYNRGIEFIDKTKDVPPYAVVGGACKNNQVPFLRSHNWRVA